MPRPTRLVPLVAALGLLVATLLARPLLAPGPVVPGNPGAVAAAPSGRVSPAGNNADTLKVRSEGTKEVDVPKIGSNSCERETLNVNAADSDDLTFLFPDKDFTDKGPLSLLVNGTHDADEIAYTVCNATGEAIDPPDGTWTYLVVKAQS
jgi:hypothetical protein